MNQSDQPTDKRRGRDLSSAGAQSYDSTDTPVLIQLPDLSLAEAARLGESREQDVAASARPPSSTNSQQRKRRIHRSHGRDPRPARSASSGLDYADLSSKLIVGLALVVVVGVTYMLLHGDGTSEIPTATDPWTQQTETGPARLNQDIAEVAAPMAEPSPPQQFKQQPTERTLPSVAETRIPQLRQADEAAEANTPVSWPVDVGLDQPPPHSSQEQNQGNRSTWSSPGTTPTNNYLQPRFGEVHVNQQTRPSVARLDGTIELHRPAGNYDQPTTR